MALAQQQKQLAGQTTTTPNALLLTTVGHQGRPRHANTHGHRRPTPKPSGIGVHRTLTDTVALHAAHGHCASSGPALRHTPERTLNERLPT
eukprot:7379616-Prymnesium_polylepis.4